ncbi:hypothetical protein RCL1_001004 [Eukaryota sp. TZLM3-RCL]
MSDKLLAIPASLLHDSSNSYIPTSSRKRTSRALDSWELKQLRAAGVGTASLIDSSSLQADDFDESLPEVITASVDTISTSIDPRMLYTAYSDQPFSLVSCPEGSMARVAANSKNLARSLKSSTSTPSHTPSSVLRSTSLQQQKYQLPSSSLPVHDYKSQIISLVSNNQCCLIVGETGSGKTTQIPQFLLESGLFPSNKIIGITQPRRVAAISIATRVAEELNTKLGDKVGYSIRFEDIQSSNTNILYLTDGVLLKEMQGDPLLSRYSVIMLDEAHERSINTDLLIGLIERTLKNRPDLKIIVTSATLDSEKFVEYLKCPVLNIPGRIFPVETFYAKTFEPDYLNSALTTVDFIHTEFSKTEAGDVLVFLTGAEEIEAACQMMTSSAQNYDKTCLKLVVLPLYSSLSSDAQKLVFAPTPPGYRKIVFATNIAETSITIDGIKFVIDCGFVKIKSFNPKITMDQLVVVPISKANAKQRSGRAGRTSPGTCFRLYTQSSYEKELIDHPIPEILRSNLVSVVLLLKSLGIIDIYSFKFLDPPSVGNVTNACQTLRLLDAVDDCGYLTPLGKRLSHFPLDPLLAKMLLASIDLKCSKQAVYVSAMLSVDEVFYRPISRKQRQYDDDCVESQRDSQLARAESAHNRFISDLGDHVTLLNVYSSWESSGFAYKWAKDNYIHFRALKEAREIVSQLTSIMDRLNLPLISSSSPVLLLKAVTVGYFLKVAKRSNDCYRTLTDNTSVYIHPSSSMIHRQPKYVIYNELVLTSKEYMRCVSWIDPRWLTKICPKLYKLQ